MKKKIDQEYHKIYFTQIINKIWKEKLSILFISFVFSLLTYCLSLFLTQKYSTQTALNNPPFNLFDDYTSNITKTNNDHFNQLLTIEIYKNLLDITNLENFVDQSTEFDSFKRFLKSRNISVKEYFKKNKIEIKKDVNNGTIIFINHTNDLEGKLFLESYIKYTKDISVAEIKKMLKVLISNRINALSKFLDIPEDEDIDFINFISKKNHMSSIHFHLIRLNKKLDDDSFDYKMLSSINSNQGIIYKDKTSIEYSLMGLIFGLFLSLAFIFLRN